MKIVNGLLAGEAEHAGVMSVDARDAENDILVVRAKEDLYGWRLSEILVYVLLGLQLHKKPYPVKGGD